MVSVRRLVLDVLKPHDPPVLAFTERVAETDGVDGTAASLIERDKEVENVALTVAGDDLDYDAVETAIEGLGGTVHSVDEVVCGEGAVPADHAGGPR